jgi:phosphoglycolate phosphatase
MSAHREGLVLQSGTVGEPSGTRRAGRLTPRLIVFDLDGTLIDSRRDLADAANALLVELGAAPLPVDAIASMVGEGAAVLVRRALRAAGVRPEPGTLLERFLSLYDERLVVHTRPYFGIPEALDVLKARSRLAVLTNKPTHPTGKILDALGLAPYFDTVVGGDTAYGRKPDPAGLLHIMDALGATPATTVLVGDSPIDRETARRAQTRVCLVRYGFGFTFRPEELLDDERVVDRPADLVAELTG